MAMPRVPGDVPQVPFQPTQMPGFAAPTAQPTQDPFPQQLQQLAAGLQDVGQASSRIGSAVQRQAATEQEQAAREQERQKIIRQREQDKLDETSASDAFNQFRMFVIPKRTEFGKLEGKDAASSYSKFVKDIADKGDEIDKGLANEMQRALFRKSRMLYELDVVNAMDVHAFQENRNYQANTRKSSAELNSQAYTESVMDSIKQKRADEFQQKMADTYGIGLPRQSMRIQPEAYKAAMASDIREAMRGQPDEAIEVQVRSAFGVMHKNTLELLASKKEFEAISSYLDANEKEIDPKVVIDYRKMASSAKIDFDATKFAIQLSAKLREKDGFVREEDYSATMSYLDVFYDSKKSGWTEEQYKAIRSAMRSIKEADDGLRSKARSEAISEAKGLIDILKSPDARAAYAQSQSQAGVDPNVHGPTQRPAVVPIISDETAEDAFRQSFPVQYAKLERLGLLDDLKEHLAGGGKSDDNALREIETDSLKDPSYYAKYPLDQFAARYGLRLSTKDFNIHFDKILAAQAKAGEKASVLSTEDEGLLLRKALVDNGIIDAASGKDLNEEIPASSVSLNVKQKWSEFTAAYKQKNAGENPSRTEYKEFLKDFFQDANVYGDQYKIGKQSAEDLDKTFVSFETSVGGQPKKFSAQFSKIDNSLIQMAQASIEDDNSKRYRVVVDTVDGPIALYPRFATQAQAVEFAGTQQARALVKELESRTRVKAISTDQDPYVDTQSDRVAVGQRALQIVANGGYVSGDGKKLQYDSNRRADFIATQYGSAKSEVGVPQGFLGNYFDFMTQPFKAGDWMSWDDAQKAYMQSKQVAFDAMKARVETLRDDINSDKYNPGQIIDSKTASMLTGYTEEELINIGAATMVKRIVPTEFGTKTFNEPILKVGGIAKYVKENYDLVTSKLKKDGIR